MTLHVPDLPIGGDSSFFLQLYARYRRDPGSVPADWRVHFERLGDDKAEPQGEGGAASELALRLIEGFRVHGHREATLDPLSLTERRPVPLLDALRREVAGRSEEVVAVPLGGAPLRLKLGELLDALQTTYAGPVALEAAHLEDDDARAWLQSAFEAAFAQAADHAMLGRALKAIALADTFEGFVRVKFPTKKRFGIEGAESAIVFLREVMRAAAGTGTTEVVMGGMHRGRLSTLATVLGKPAGMLLAEIKGRDLTGGGPHSTGDVPYHLGYAGEVAIDGQALEVSILPHPSHLLTVAPVAMGMARGRREGRDRDLLCLLAHTDAAFSGQGLAAEIMQLGGLAGYRVGGTIHLVVNNQIGFTTLPSEGRTGAYCTDIGKAVGAAIFHVNGDDPVAVARVAEIAVAFRSRFRRDVLVDLVCFRRNGHNELDEPRFTYPAMWERIDATRPLRERFAAQVAERAPHEKRAADEAAETFRAELQAGYEAIETYRPNAGSSGDGPWGGIAAGGEREILAPVETGIDLDRLVALGQASCRLDGIGRSHPKVEAFYRARLNSIESGQGINFATAEALAFATLLAQGVTVRLSGQDSVRGTFTQRHLAVHDMASGATAFPLDVVAAQGARFEAVNSPLSEYGVLGFEYGVSLARPDRLVLWEAQFGDFLNGAQIAVDQYIVSAEAKWGVMSGLVVLLPHGLEGQGPDHSSARIERLLQLCAGGNVIVANPSTPANLFHLLRRQICAPWRKPLFVIAPKSLLRQRAAASVLGEMGPGRTFLPVIGDEAAEAGTVRRVVLSSGKIFYDLHEARRVAGLERQVALLRVEQLYPLAVDDLAAALAPFREAELVWCQEEPANQGAWDHIRRVFEEDAIAALPSSALRLVARPALPVAAGGSIERHEAEQADIVRRALGG
jgi:2-oxoglutarate dehydrogenase E1 component